MTTKTKKQVPAKRTRKNPETTSGFGYMTEHRYVNDYLTSLTSGPQRPSGTRFRNPEAQLESIDHALAHDDLGPVERLELVQKRLDLQNFLDNDVVDVSLEDDFVKVAQSFATRKGIKYAAWREMGVPASVLKKAGIDRT